MCVEEWGVCKNGVCVLKEGVGGVRMVRVCVCVRMVCVCVYKDEV